MKGVISYKKIIFTPLSCKYRDVRLLRSERVESLSPRLTRISECLVTHSDWKWTVDV